MQIKSHVTKPMPYVRLPRVFDPRLGNDTWETYQYNQCAQGLRWMWYVYPTETEDRPQGFELLRERRDAIRN
jgi:hypothetical protein